MQHLRSFGRVSFLALSVLSACAMADPSARAGTGVAPPATGVFGHYLAGEFAFSQSEPGIAADAFLKALAASPHDHTLLQQAFLASAMSGRPQAVELARQLPDNQVAQLVLGDHEALLGHWQAAEQRFRSLPNQGLTQLLRPLLVAWSQQGAGNTQQALATLRPLVTGPRFQGIFALHAAMIADLGGNMQQAAQLYRVAQDASPDTNLRLAQILASWQRRSGNPDEARGTLSELGNDAPELSIAVPGLIGMDQQRPVRNAAEGIAEAYVALAGALRGQNAGNFATLMVRFALDMRPDFTAARLVGSALLATDQQNAAALRILVPVADSDPLAPLVQLRRAALNERLGHADMAMQSLERLARQHPHNPLPLIMEGDIQRTQKHYQEAVTAYTRAIAEIGRPSERDWGVFYSRGIAFDQMHDWPKAQADFEQSLHLSPDQPSVLNYLGYSWADANRNLGQARAMIEKAIQRRPNDGAITDSLGWVMLRQGEVATAVNTLQRAVELEPEDATINGHLGDAYWAAGRKLEAEYQWRRALTLNPTPDDAAKLEAKLQLPSKAAMISGQ